MQALTEMPITVEPVRAEPTISVEVTSVEVDGSLPTWIIAPILASLVAISGLIVLLGWLLVRPFPTSVEVEPPIAAPSPEPVREAKAFLSAPQQVRPAIQVDDSWIEEVGPPLEPVLLQRRMPSFEEAPLKLPDDRDDARRPIAAILPTPIQWTREKESPGVMNLIMPVEIARIDDGTIPHSLRRLQLPAEAPKRLKLAVSPVAHDDLGSVLTRMGEGYHYKSLRREEIRSLPALRKHDVVFLTCSDLYAEDFQAVLPLRKFVEEGGTLYASDLYGDLLSVAFPEFRVRVPMVPGVPQRVEAMVLDSGMHAYLGWSVIPLHFDAADWRPAPFDPARVTVCLRGEYRNNLGQTRSAPLLVKFRCKKGTVIFTSFHHTKNDSATVQKVLDYLIFASLSARSEARVRDLMQRSGFTPNDLRPAHLTKGVPIEATHKHKGGSLQIALGFEHLGARLKLAVRSPSGKVLTHEAEGIYLVEIPNAEAGEWCWSVTPLELPHANFPIVVAIGAARAPAKQP